MRRPRRSCSDLSGRGGIGLGLRFELLEELEACLPATIDWLEVAPENYMGRGGRERATLERLRARYPVLTHGLTMSVGGTEPLDGAYLEGVGAFVSEVGSPWHSDHLCFSASGGQVLHELLPVRRTPRAVARIAARLRTAEEALGVPMAVENISCYLAPAPDEMDEPEFLSRLCDASGCGLMLDVNNVHVNAHNFGFDARAWLDRAPLERVVQMHVAGPDRHDDELLVDTHGTEVPAPVLDLLAHALERTGAVPIILERDQAFPPLADLLGELARVREVYERVLGKPPSQQTGRREA